MRRRAVVMVGVLALASAQAVATSAPEPKGTTVDIAAVGDIVMGTPQYGLPRDGGASFFAPVTPRWPDPRVSVQSL